MGRSITQHRETGAYLIPGNCAGAIWKGKIGLKVIVEGKKPEPAWPKKFRCIHCESVLEVEADDLKYAGSQYNESFYEYYCPVCQTKRTVGDGDLKKIHEEG